MKRSITDDERGQAFTLEGFIGAIVLLTAILLALQSVVITPATGGLGDRSVQAQVQQEATDALVVAEEQGDLTEMILEMSEDIDDQYDENEFAEEYLLGELLQNQSYNVDLVYYNESERSSESIPVVQQAGGIPSSSVVTASHTVVLLDGYDVGDEWPNDSIEGSNVYDVVEVRVTVW